MLEDQSFKHMANILDYPMFLTHHIPSNDQISRQSHAGGSVIKTHGDYAGLFYIFDLS